MPKMRGLQRRLADLSGAKDAAPADAPLAGDALLDVVEDSTKAGLWPSPTPAMPGRWAGDTRPSIVVEGDADLLDVQTGSGQVEPVGGIAPSWDDVIDDGWQLSLVGGLFPAVRRRPSVPIAPTDRDTSVNTSIAPTDGDISADTLSRLSDPVVGDDKSRRPVVIRARAARPARAKAQSSPAPPASCPYCAQLLEPAPTSSQHCGRCRQRIIVRRFEGRSVYLTEAALLVFEAERRRLATSGRLTRERDRWLRLAAAAGARTQRHEWLAAARLSEEVVGASRTLYLTTVDRAFRAAKRDHDWETASHIQREKAVVLYRVAGLPLPPPADIVAMFREAVRAQLRGIVEISRDAELVSSSCCDVCRADDGLIFRVAHELRVPRLPHEGCPRGLCRCRWDLAARDRATMRRYLRRRPRAESRATSNEPPPTV